MTATRMSLLAPATWPHECAESATAPVANADDLRNERRVSLFIEDLFSSGVIGVTVGDLGGFLVAIVKIEAVAQRQAAARGDGVITHMRLVLQVFEVVLAKGIRG